MSKTRKIILACVVGTACLVLAVVALGWGMLYRLNIIDDAPAAGAVIPETNGTLSPLAESGDDWPCWRGPNRDNASSVTGIRTDWSGGLRKVWEVDYLGQGKSNATWSAPVIRGNRLVVVGRDEKSDLVFCLDPGTGKLLWRQSYEAKAGTGHGRGPRATPTIDGEKVFTFGRSGDVACWRLYDGGLVWRRNVKDDGGEVPTWGYASAPLILDGNVFVQAGGSCRTVAYDKATGSVVWKSSEGTAGYAAPMLMQTGARLQLVVFHGKGIAGLDPEDGRVIWDLPWETDYDVNATTPVASGATLFMTSGYGRGCQALTVSETGAKVLWTGKVFASHHSDPFIIDGFVYGYSGQSYQNRGRFKCAELATGNERWSTGEIGWGTTVMVDGHFVCLDIDGNLFLVKADPAAFVKVTEFRGALKDIRNPAWTIPVIVRGNVYLRHKQRLICYDLTGQSRRVRHPPVGLSQVARLC